MLGAAGGFLIGRYLGREFAATLIGDRLKKYDDAIERNGFATVLYLRLAYFPFTPMNSGMGLTRVDAGITSGARVGHPGRHLHFYVLRRHRKGGLGHRPVGQSALRKVFFSLGLFIFSLFIPKIINKLKVWQDLRTT